MYRVALTLSLCALTAGVAVGQSGSIDVPAAGRSIALSVQIVPGNGEKVAHAASRPAEPDGVMILPMPGSSYMLRTEKFNDSCDVTTMVPKDGSSMGSLSSDSVCTTRWMSGKTAHCLVSTMAKGEDMAAWSRRHDEAMLMITAVYVPSSAPMTAQSMPASDDSRDMAKTPWMDAMGNQHEVATKRRDGEAREAWLARHREAVMAFTAVMAPKA